MATTISGVNQLTPTTTSNDPSILAVGGIQGVDNKQDVQGCDESVAVDVSMLSPNLVFGIAAQCPCTVLLNVFKDHVNVALRYEAVGADI